MDEIQDPFDPRGLRLSQDYDTVGVKKLLTTVPVRKPGKHDFVRVRPEVEFSETLGLLQVGDDREYYVIVPALAGELTGEFATYLVHTAINRQGTLFLWPIRMPGPDGKQSDWTRSAHEGAARAVKGWVRIVANMNLGAYDIHLAAGALPDPEWPEHSFGDLLRAAFQNRIVDRLDHPLISQLRGLT
jgi:hypothetical protein